MSRDVEARIAALAAGQHGVVTYRQLIQAGLSSAGVGRRLGSGRLWRLHRGVYRTTPFDLQHTAAMAAVLATDGGALSHASAASLWGARAAPPSTVPIDVSVQANRGRHQGIRTHRVVLPDHERTVHEGIPVTTPARTLLDLATVIGTSELEAAVARAERDGLVTLAALASMLARHRGHAGTRALRMVLRLPGGPALTRSPAEARFLALVREADLPPPECNVRIGRHEVDFLWRSARLVVEVDGFRYHSTRPRFEGDRRKDAELVAAGFTVLHLSWRQIVEHPTATAVRIGQALVRAEARR